MFYLNFLKDKYKVSYICCTPKCENHYRIREEPETTIPRNTHLTPKARRLNSNRPKTRQHKRKVETWGVVGYYLVVLLDNIFFLRPISWGGSVPLNGLHTPKFGPVSWLRVCTDYFFGGNKTTRHNNRDVSG